MLIQARRAVDCHSTMLPDFCSVDPISPRVNESMVDWAAFRMLGRVHPEFNSGGFASLSCGPEWP